MLIPALTRKIFQTGWLMALPCLLPAQQTPPIELVNPSFEDIPRSSFTPFGWYDCGQMKDSPPDVQPGFWEVSTPPEHGHSYLGLVVRDNETWEGVNQRLSRPLEINQCYKLSMYLSKAPKYLSKSPLSTDVVDFTTPACVLIWGGNGYCDKAELLAMSKPVAHQDWQLYDFYLQPESFNFTFLLLEVYYQDPELPPYNGHVLIDNLSPIYPVPCE